MRTQLHQIVADSSRRNAARPALTYKDETLTYGELWDEVSSFASGLSGIGLERGQRVGIYLDKRIETVVSIFGTSAAGGDASAAGAVGGASAAAGASAVGFSTA